MVGLKINSFGKTLRDIRINNNLTQQMLSEHICAQSVLSRIENDEELPNVVVMHRLCQRLGVTIDQVMNTQTEHILVAIEISEKAAEYLKNREYQHLHNLLIHSKIAEKIYLDTDWQKYYYYFGNCEVFLRENLSEALSCFKKSLSFSDPLKKNVMSELEVELVSTIGFIYHQLGNQILAEKYLLASVAQVEANEQTLHGVIPTKIFYHYAIFLFENEQSEQAGSMVDQGIYQARKHCSYFYLYELYHLKAELLEVEKSKIAAARFRQMANNLKTIITVELSG